MSRLSRAARHRIVDLAEAVDKVVNSDVRFFQRHPHREFRIRVAAQAELAQYRAMEHDDVTETRLGCSWYVLVRQISPGIRIRVPAQGPAHHDVDLDERTVRLLWAQIVAPDIPHGEIEHRMMLAAARGSAPS